MKSIFFAFLFCFFGAAFGKIVRLSSPFHNCGSDPSGSGLCLSLSPVIYGQLQSLDVGDSVEFSSFPVAHDRTVALSLTRFSAAENLEDLPLVVLLRGQIFESESQLLSGEVEPVAESTVFLALSQHGSNGFFEFKNETFYISTPFLSVDESKPAMDQYVNSLSKMMKLQMGVSWSAFSFNRATVICEKSSLFLSNDFPQTDYILPPQSVIDETDKMIEKSSLTKEIKLRKTYRVASDVDFQMFRARGSNYDSTSSYYYTLVGSASSIFRRDFGHDIVSSYVFIYTTQDPYPYDTMGCLNYMTSRWNPSNPSRSFATLVSAKSLGGGVAYLRTLCNTAWAYGVNGNMVGYFPTPLRNNDANNWDIYVWTHETGHIWGAQHTHELNPPADRCGSTPGCGPTTGTIMSYCHTCGNGMTNIVLNFHQYTKNEVIPFTNSVSC